MKKILPLLLLLLVMSGCRTSKQATKVVEAARPECLASKVEYHLPMKGKVMSFGGSMKMRGGERLQFSIQTPIIRTEAGRLELTPDEVLLIDRLGKRYVRTSRKALERYVPLDKFYRAMENFVRDAAKPGGKNELTAADLGLDQFAKAGMTLYNFSHEPFELPATEVSSRYRQVTPEELLQILKKML